MTLEELDKSIELNKNRLYKMKEAEWHLTQAVKTLYGVYLNADLLANELEKLRQEIPFTEEKIRLMVKEWVALTHEGENNE